MIFPFYDDEDEIEETTAEEETQYLPLEYGVDFETGKLTGKIVEGIDAVVVWAWLALQTAKGRYYVYSLEYGQEYDEMIGKGYSKAYIDAELKRMTEECLTFNPYITGIENFSCELEGDRVILNFRIVTTFGESGEVSAIV